MDRNVQKNGLVNLIAAVMIFIAAVIVTSFVHSLAGMGASIFLGLGALAAFTSWFQMRLEENEQLERMEVEEYARARGESALFDAKESEVFPARRSREQFEKYFVPGVAVLLFILEAGGAWVLWQWIGKTTVVIVGARAMASLSLFAIFALVLFLIGRFSVTMARLENQRLLRPGASFLLAGAYVCFFTALAIAGVQTEFPNADVWLARAFCILLGLMAAEILLTLLLEIYRPRVKGKIVRPLYDSRVVGLLAQPESFFTAAAQTLDYQFGFKVSETWFFQLLKENLPLLIFAQVVILFLSSSVVFIDAGEQAVLEHYGKPVAVLQPGAHLKWPWPVDKIYRYHTDQIQSLYVGFTPGTNENATILWTIPHNKEENFLVANRASATFQPETSGDDTMLNQLLKAPPVSLISVSIPVEFQITNVMDWAYQNSDATNLLADLAENQVIRLLAGENLSDVLAEGRLEAAQKLHNWIQAAADARRLGVKIVFVGLQDVHPPTPVASDYEKVIGAEQTALAKELGAKANAIATNALAVAQSFIATNTASAYRVQLETSAFARAALFTNQIPAYEAAPSVYKQRKYYLAFGDATKNAQKYILLVTNTDDVLIFDLENKIRSDLLNVNPE